MRGQPLFQSVRFFVRIERNQSGYRRKEALACSCKAGLVNRAVECALSLEGDISCDSEGNGESLCLI